MKTILATIAALTILTTTASAQDRTQDYRMWSAEQMINRLTITIGNNLTPSIIKSIREAAATGNEVLWAETIDVVHKLEIDIARAKNKAAREQQEAKYEQERSEFERQRARASLDNYYSRRGY